VFWGAISSSGVPAAIVDYWQYFEAFRQFGPRKCVEATQDVVEYIDDILLDKSKARTFGGALKELFGFNLTDNVAFAGAATTIGFRAWQSQNWDPDISTAAVSRYCANITTGVQLYPTLSKRAAGLRRLRKLSRGDEMTDEMVNRTLNYIGYVKVTTISPCDSRKKTHEECFTPNRTRLAQDDIKSSKWRSWAWQYVPVNEANR
jgi:hypothetical protein